MKIIIITPAPPQGWQGNRTTAVRWARLLQKSGHRVEIGQEYAGEKCDILIALHARKSYEAIRKFREKYPGKPLILALTGTDLYQDIRHDEKARKSLALADRLIVLQPLGINELPEVHREKARVIFQSVPQPNWTITPKKDIFEVCVISNLREIKDPFRAAYAARELPSGSKIKIVHIGEVLNPEMQQIAEEESRTNFRYRWLGGLPHDKTMRILGRSRAMVNSSLLEGGANVLSEAIALGVPVLASQIPGNEGILQPHYPAYFPAKDTWALAEILDRIETDRTFYQKLKAYIEDLRDLIHPIREEDSLQRLLKEF